MRSFLQSSTQALPRTDVMEGGQRGHRPLFSASPSGLMMVVEKTIRDRVLNAIYKEMGMAKSQRHRLLPPRLRKTEKRNDFYKKAPERVLFAARITNNGSKGKNPSYSSFRANAVSRESSRVADFTLFWYFSATCVDFSTPLALKA